VGDPVQASSEAEESAKEAAALLAQQAADAGDVDEDAPYESAEQLDAKLVTLSSLPRSRWANLGRLDIIRRRNRPEAPPKAPALAPFFLNTVPGLSTTFKPMEDPLGEGEAGPRSHIVNFGKLGALSAFQKTLCDCGESQDCEWRGMVGAWWCRWPVAAQGVGGPEEECGAPVRLTLSPCLPTPLLPASRRALYGHAQGNGTGSHRLGDSSAQVSVAPKRHAFGPCCPPRTAATRPHARLWPSWLTHVFLPQPLQRGRTVSLHAGLLRHVAGAPAGLRACSGLS